MKKLLKIMGLSLLIAVCGIGLIACSSMSGTRSQYNPDEMEVEFSYNTYKYDYYHNPLSYSISLYQGKSNLEELIIPETYNGLPVIAIEDKAFANCPNLTTVTLSSNVTTIGNYAFSGCLKLEDINIPESVVFIGEDAFSDCPCVEVLGCFSHVGKWVVGFDGSTTTPVVPSSLTKLAILIFSYSDITSITLPSTLEGMCGWTFQYCNTLTEIYYEGNLDSWVTINGLGAVIDKKIFIDDVDITTVKDIVLTSATAIEPYAFYHYSNLENITIPNTVEKIGTNAFSDCVNLKGITIPSSVKVIEDDAFAGCKSVDEINLSDGIVQIGQAAFKGCEAITNLIIPNSVKDIGYEAFCGCSNLTNLVVGDGLSALGQRVFADCFMFGYDKPAATVTLGKNLKRIECREHGDNYYDTFRGNTNISTIYFMGNLNDWINLVGSNGIYTAYYIFYETTSVRPTQNSGSQTLYINGVNVDSIIKIEESDFAGTTRIGFGVCRNFDGLTDVVISDGIEYMGQYAFYSCGNLKNITIPVSVTYIDWCCLADCYSLTNINYRGTKAQWNEISKFDGWNSGVPSSCIIHCVDGDISI